jgi:ribonuclease HI
VVFVWQEEVYQIEYDGASKRNPGPAGAGALVRAPNGSVVNYLFLQSLQIVFGNNSKNCMWKEGTFSI